MAPRLRTLERLWAESEPRRADKLAHSGLDAADLRAARETVRRLLGALAAADPP